MQNHLVLLGLADAAYQSLSGLAALLAHEEPPSQGEEDLLDYTSRAAGLVEAILDQLEAQCTTARKLGLVPVT